jgi:hypothetical protein
MGFDAETATAEMIKEVGLYGLKTLLTINAGAIIVLLSFVGSIDDSTKVIFDIFRLKLSMYFFLAGLTMIIFAIAIIYVNAQNTFVNRKAAGTFRWHLIKMIGLSSLSLILFILGVYTAVSGISAP